MNPIQNLVLRAARQVNEYIVQVIDSREPGTGGDLKSLAHLETTLFQTLFDNLKPGYPDHYVAEPGESPASAKKDHVWTVQGFDDQELFARRMPTCTYSIVHKHNGKIVDALVINPFTGEEYTASRGNGASLNSRRIRCSNERSIDGLFLSSNLINNKLDTTKQRVAIDLLSDLKEANVELISTNNPTIDAAMVASGQVDAALLANVATADLEGALLLCQESGALVGTLGGDLVKEGKRHNLVVANPKLYKMIVQRYCGYDKKLLG